MLTGAPYILNESAYQNLVQPSIQYSSTVLDPHTQNLLTQDERFKDGQHISCVRIVKENEKDVWQTWW